MKKAILATASLLLVLTSSTVFASADEQLKYNLDQCAKNNPDACGYLGFLYQTGLFVKQSLAEAHKYYQKSCNLNGNVACGELGYLYEQGTGVNKSYSEARKYYQKGCHLHYSQACDRLGSLYAKGLGVEKSFTKAKEYYELACQLSNSQCGNLGVLYAKGDGVKQSYKEAWKYFERGCNGGDRQACANLGYLFETGNGPKKNLVEAARYYESACRSNEPFACYSLGSLYESGKGVKQSKSKAKEFYGKACKLGYVDACPADAKKNKPKGKPILGFVVLGETTPDQVKEKLRSMGCHFSINNTDIIAHNCYSSLPGNPKVTFRNLLGPEIDVVLLSYYREYGKQGTFTQYVNALKKTYGKPGKYKNPFVGDQFASWNKNDIYVEVNERHMGEGCSVLYETKQVKKAFEDQKEFKKQQKQKALDLL